MLIAATPDPLDDDARIPWPGRIRRHGDELLARGKVAETRDTTYGPSHRVLSSLTGPNGREATLVTCWLIEDRAGISVPKLTTAWVQPHREKETER